MGEKIKIKLLIILLILASIFLYGCRFKSAEIPEYELPEGKEIKNTVDTLASAVAAMDIQNYISCFSSDCSLLQKINEDITSAKSQNVKFKNYVMSIESLKRYDEGVEASINTQWEASVEGKKVSGSAVRNIYFSKENDIWKIKDYYFHPYNRPSVVVGSSSLLSPNAQVMAEALDSELLLDVNHLQASGDIILLGTAYDNASILELEIENLTYVRVTEDYPGSGLGIVQVIPNIKNYRHAILIQGSSLQSAKNAVSFMTQYLIEHKYMEPGVYIIKDDKIRKAELLELTSLTSLNHSKSYETLERAQNVIEYNIKLISDEAALERDNISFIEKNISNDYRKDYKEAFAYDPTQRSQSQAVNMGIISSYFIDKYLCAKAFELPLGGDIDTLYSVSMSAKVKSPQYITALLRLAGFQGDEVFNFVDDDASAVFANIAGGCSLDLHTPLMQGVSRQYIIEDLKSIENDGYYLNLKDNSTNMPKEDIVNSINGINNAFSMKKELLQSRIARKDFSKDEQLSSSHLPFSTVDIYELLQNSTPYYKNMNSFPSLSEAKDALRAAMGELLSLKCRKYILNLAGKYPGSQYDCSRYSAGLVSVEHPEAYAAAVRESGIIKSKASEISSAYKEREARIEGILNFLSTIKTEEKAEDFFLQPQSCIESNKGDYMNKALLVYGLYSNLINKSDDTWVVISEDSSYVAFKDDYGYKYIDCRYNALSRTPDPSIYLCFNEKYAYNARLGIGEKPEFMK